MKSPSRDEINTILAEATEQEPRHQAGTILPFDDGETWKHIKELEPMTEWPKRCIHAYPSLAFLNGNAHITYYESKKHANRAYRAFVSPRTPGCRHRLRTSISPSTVAPGPSWRRAP